MNSIRRVRLVETPLDVLDAADRQSGQPLKRRGREVKVEGIAARAAIDDLDGHGVAAVYHNFSINGRLKSRVRGVWTTYSLR